MFLCIMYYLVSWHYCVNDENNVYFVLKHFVKLIVLVWGIFPTVEPFISDSYGTESRSPQWDPDRLLPVQVIKAAAYNGYKKFGKVINRW